MNEELFEIVIPSMVHNLFRLCDCTLRGEEGPLFSLEAVFKKLNAAGLMLKTFKCEMFKTETLFDKMKNDRLPLIRSKGYAVRHLCWPMLILSGP